MINQLADKFQPDAAALFGAGFNALDWRRDFGARLLHQPLESLSKALNAPTLSVAQSALVSSSSVAKHTTNDNWVINYLATPCRIVDTRFGGGGVLGPVSRNWAASTVTASIIAGQGGNAAGCGSFPNANGWVLYVTVVPAVAGPNFLTVQHSSAVPTTATMTYYSQVLSNFAVTSNFDGGVGDGGFYAYTSGSTHVVIDLLAWTGTPTPLALGCLDVESAISVISAGAAFSISAPACAAGYTHTGPYFRNSTTFSNLLVVNNFYPLGSTLNCQGTNGTGGSVSLQCGVRCCRVQ